MRGSDRSKRVRAASKAPANPLTLASMWNFPKPAGREGAASATASSSSAAVAKRRAEPKSNAMPLDRSSNATNATANKQQLPSDHRHYLSKPGAPRMHVSGKLDPQALEEVFYSRHGCFPDEYRMRCNEEEEEDDEEDCDNMSEKEKENEEAYWRRSELRFKKPNGKRSQSIKHDDAHLATGQDVARQLSLVDSDDRHSDSGDKHLNTGGATKRDVCSLETELGVHDEISSIGHGSLSECRSKSNVKRSRVFKNNIGERHATAKSMTDERQSRSKPQITGGNSSKHGSSKQGNDDRGAGEIPYVDLNRVASSLSKSKVIIGNSSKQVGVQHGKNSDSTDDGSLGYAFRRQAKTMAQMNRKSIGVKRKDVVDEDGDDDDDDDDDELPLIALTKRSKSSDKSKKKKKKKEKKGKRRKREREPKDCSSQGDGDNDPGTDQPIEATGEVSNRLSKNDIAEQVTPKTFNLGDQLQFIQEQQQLNRQQRDLVCGIDDFEDEEDKTIKKNNYNNNNNNTENLTSHTENETQPKGSFIWPSSLSNPNLSRLSAKRNGSMFASIFHREIGTRVRRQANVGRIARWYSQLPMQGLSSRCHVSNIGIVDQSDARELRKAVPASNSTTSLAFDSMGVLLATGRTDVVDVYDFDEYEGSMRQMMNIPALLPHNFEHVNTDEQLETEVPVQNPTAFVRPVMSLPVRGNGHTVKWQPGHLDRLTVSSYLSDALVTFDLATGGPKEARYWATPPYGELRGISSFTYIDSVHGSNGGGLVATSTCGKVLFWDARASNKPMWHNVHAASRSQHNYSFGMSLERSRSRTASSNSISSRGASTPLWVSCASKSSGHSRASSSQEASKLTSVVQVTGTPILVLGDNNGLLSAMDLRKTTVPLFGQSAAPQLLGKCAVGYCGDRNEESWTSSVAGVTHIEPHPNRHGEVFVQTKTGSIWGVDARTWTASCAAKMSSKDYPTQVNTNSYMPYSCSSGGFAFVPLLGGGGNHVRMCATSPGSRAIQMLRMKGGGAACGSVVEATMESDHHVTCLAVQPQNGNVVFAQADRQGFAVMGPRNP